jgi:hypothetical protein
MAFQFPEINADAPDGVVIGVIAESSTALRQAVARADARVVGPADQLDLSPGCKVLLIDHAFALVDALAREKAAIHIDHLRRTGVTVLLVSHEEELLLRLADEIWWLRDGLLAGRGDPQEMLAAYRKHVSDRLREWGGATRLPIAPRMRRGDGRAEVVTIDTLGEDGRPTAVWRSGELVVVKVLVRFREAVADPVVGIMIRTHVGLNVYGTNTELERLKLGPHAAGDTIEITFAFRCELCPGEYTLTVASHDPDGVWHDWLEDAVAFAVSDTRYTAGVANLRAQVSFIEK